MFFLFSYQHIASVELFFIHTKIFWQYLFHDFYISYNKIGQKKKYFKSLLFQIDINEKIFKKRQNWHAVMIHQCLPINSSLVTYA